MAEACGDWKVRYDLGGHGATLSCWAGWRQCIPLAWKPAWLAAAVNLRVHLRVLRAAIRDAPMDCREVREVGPLCCWRHSHSGGMGNLSISGCKGS